jgi:hypothetical protein
VFLTLAKRVAVPLFVAAALVAGLGAVPASAGFAFRATNLQYIEFQDNNGESGTTIGWANQQNYGFWVDNCQNP